MKKKKKKFVVRSPVAQFVSARNKVIPNKKTVYVRTKSKKNIDKDLKDI